MNTNIIAAFLLPPLNLIVLLALGTLMQNGRHKRLGKCLVWLALAILYLLSTPWASHHLLSTIEPPPATPRITEAQAIVVLGGGIHRAAPEYGTDTVSGLTLERLRYAARLHHATALPLLVSGGAPQGGLVEALAMRDSLLADFGATVRWVEPASINTADNARLSWKILQPLGIKRILLVTHAWHMRRAQAAFTRAGFEVFPAPTIYSARQAVTVLDYLPSAQALLRSRDALHEWIGLAWYKLRGMV